MTSGERSRRARLPILGLVLLFAVSSCGGDDPSEPGSSPAETSQGEATDAEQGNDTDEATPRTLDIPADPVELTEAQTVCLMGEPIDFSATTADGTVIERADLPVAMALATSPSPGQTWLVVADQPYDFVEFGEKAPGTVTLVLKLTTPADDPFASATYTSADGEVEVQWTIDADTATYSADRLGRGAEVVVDAAGDGVLCGTVEVSFADAATGEALVIDAQLPASLQAWPQ